MAAPVHARHDRCAAAPVGSANRRYTATERKRIVPRHLTPAHAPCTGTFVAARIAISVRLKRRQIEARFRIGRIRCVRDPAAQAPEQIKPQVAYVS